MEELIGRATHGSLGERNEVLDLTVYSLAALHILGQAFVRPAAEVAPSPAPDPYAARAALRRMGRRSCVYG